MSERNTEPDIRVRKRDGTLEAFAMPKLLNCIQVGLAASSDIADMDPATARGLAEAVYDYLVSTLKNGPVTSERIADLIDFVLTQTGQGAVAMQIRQFAHQRDRQRRKVLVAVHHADGRVNHRRWDKGRLVKHMRDSHLLDAPASRMIAGRVEQLIFNCGLRVVTAGLVEEMARSELLAWGLLPAALVVKRNSNARGNPKVRDNIDLG
jgi:hypothetical protein